MHVQGSCIGVIKVPERGYKGRQYNGTIRLCIYFFNQLCTGHRPARAWLFDIALLRACSVCVGLCMCVCPPARL